MTQLDDYYSILEIEPGSSLKDIRAAYRKVALKYHPDRAKIDAEKAAELFKKLTQASDVLCDDRKRAEYDLNYYAKKHVQKRYEELNENVRKLREDLEKREKLSSFSTKKASDHKQAARIEKIMSIRKENKARMEEESLKYRMHLKSIFHTAKNSKT